MRPDFTQEPEIPAFSVLGYMAVVLGHAEASYRRGAAVSVAISDALGRHEPPAAIANVCRFAWSVMVEPTHGAAYDGPPRVVAASGDIIERRDVEPHELLDRLRVMLGTVPEHTAQGEHAATIERVLSPVIHAVDVAAWLGWCIVGLRLFSGEHPTMLALRDETRRFGVVLALLRSGGSLSAAERLTGTNRSRLRLALRGLGLYPWPR